MEIRLFLYIKGAGGGLICVLILSLFLFLYIKGVGVLCTNFLLLYIKGVFCVLTLTVISSMFFCIYIQ